MKANKFEIINKFFHDFINKVSIVVILMENGEPRSKIKEQMEAVSSFIDNCNLSDDFGMFFKTRWEECKTKSDILHLCDSIDFYQQIMFFVNNCDIIIP